MFCSHCGHENIEDAAFCQKCGKKIGQPASEAPTAKSPVEESSTSEVSDEKDSWKKKWQKAAVIICFTLGLFWMINDGIKGCENAADIHGLNSAVELVKNGHFEGYVEKTVGEMVEGFFGSAKWESGTTSVGEAIVNVRGKMQYNENEVEGLLQFNVDEVAGTFEINAFEINGLAQNRSMISALVEEMYK